MILVVPRERLNVHQVAGYLHLPEQEVRKLASRGRIPARRVGTDFVFRKAQIDRWVERRMRHIPPERLAQIERGVSAHHGLDHTSALVTSLIPDAGVVVPLPARTRDGVLRALADAADAAELIYDRNDLVEELREREQFCPTAVAPGVALPHPAHPLPYDIARSFVIVARTQGRIPFGCPDGTLTRLFFLICCKDERTHLHVLARICRMLDAATVDALMSAQDADQLLRLLVVREAAVPLARR